jgi:hypothetical protein
MTTKDKTHEIEAFIKKANEDGKTRGAIEGYLQFEYDMSTNDAKAKVQEVLGKSTRSSQDLAKVVQVVRENYNKVDKQTLIAKMMEASGGTESSMSHMYNYIKFAIEFAKQECEANK